jgi:putative Mn2+ efflux pump MntP
VSFAFLKISIATPIIVIGVVTFALSYLGTYVGTRLGHFFERKIGILGGLILIGIGTKILLEHLV